MRELPRHCGSNVAAINGEALIKEKHGCTDNHQFRQWIQQFANATHDVHAHRKSNEAGSDNYLESNSVRQNDI